MIYGCSLLFLLGTLLIAAVAMGNDMIQTLFHTKATHNETMRLIYFGLALGIIAFGTGGIKANVSPFGADQVKQSGQRAVQTFFNWFYFFINVGSLIALQWLWQCNNHMCFTAIASQLVQCFLL